MEPHTFDVSEAEFDAKVLARSRQVPVVVDFWAGWCAPCRMLGPTLEREVEALGGRVELAKVDVDANQALAGKFGVRGIPAVMAFRGGEVVDEFTGARDAGFVRRFLAGLSPSEALQRLERAGSPGDLEALLDDPEVGPQAALQLATLHAGAGRAAEALAALEKVPARAALHEQAQALRGRLALIAEAAAFGGEATARAAVAADPGDVAARYALGCALAGTGRLREALEAFLEVVSRDRKFKDDGARKAMLALFEQAGADLAREFRRRLQVVL